MVRIFRNLCVALACATARGLRSDVDLAGSLEAGDQAIPAGAFSVGQLVQVRDSWEEWKVGTVTSLNPLKVTPEGWDSEFRWRFVRPSTASAWSALVERKAPAEAAAANGAPDPMSALMPQLPEEPGCYVWMPSGCPKNVALKASSQWHRDQHGEEHGAFSRQGCSARARSFNSWCGAADARMHFVLPKAPPAPTEPGCYVRYPTGCPKQNLRAQTSWKRDAHGEKFFGAAESKSICEADRKRMFDFWCGMEDTDMVFVAQAGHSESAPMLAPMDVHDSANPVLAPVGVPDRAYPAASTPEVQTVREPGAPEPPAQPGCFVWMPSGCPKNRAFKATAAWRRDERGEEEKGARLSEKACQARASSFNSWCGADDARMLFIVPPLPAAPTAPGCYVLHRSGCPRQSGVRVRDEWQRDSSGEENFKAAESREACESQRKLAFDAWCGVDDTAMMFVPKAAEDRDGQDRAAEGAWRIAAADRADGFAGAGEEVGGGGGSARRAGASQVMADRITNLNGHDFKIRRPGSYTLLEFAQGGAPSLVVEGRVEAAWACAFSVREVALSGPALGKDSLRVRVGSKHGAGAGLEVQMQQDGPWMPLANASTPSPHGRHFWAWLRPKLPFWPGHRQAGTAQAAGDMVVLKTYKAAGSPVELLARGAQAGPKGTEADFVDIHAGGSVLRVSLSGAKEAAWLDVALDASGATAPARGAGNLTGLLAYDEPRHAWLEPTEECALSLGEGHLESHVHHVDHTAGVGLVRRKD